MSQNGQFTAETTFYVRYAETDAMSIVHHASYIVYFEEARSHYARVRGNDYAEFEKTGHFLAVVEVNARYSKPARYGDLLAIRCWIEEMKSRSLKFGYEIRNANTGETLVTGVTSHVCITHAGQVAKIPDAWRAWSE